MQYVDHIQTYHAISMAYLSPKGKADGVMCRLVANNMVRDGNLYPFNGHPPLPFMLGG